MYTSYNDHTNLLDYVNFFNKKSYASFKIMVK